MSSLVELHAISCENILLLNNSELTFEEIVGSSLFEQSIGISDVSSFKKIVAGIENVIKTKNPCICETISIIDALLGVRILSIIDSKIDSDPAILPRYNFIKDLNIVINQIEHILSEIDLCNHNNILSPIKDFYANSLRNGLCTISFGV